MTVALEITDDPTVLLAVQHAHDAAAHGAPGHSDAEMRELLEVTDEVLLARSDDVPAAFAARWPQGAEIVGDPATALAQVYPALLTRLTADGCPEVQFAADDTALLDAVTAAGWTYAHSIHALSRPVGELDLPQPRWPDGVGLRDFETAQAWAVHRMIYLDAGWSEVVGHHDRTFDQWATVFLDPAPDPPVVAWRGDTPVGAALTKRLSSGEGHIAQIAVARGERGSGLGRALVLETFRRMARHEDVSSLGLEVITTNAHALDLYLSLGLQETHQSLAFDAPSTP